MMPERSVRSGDVDLAIYRWGESGDRPTVVLVHGYPDSAQVWKPVAEALAAHYQVVAYDVRGAGRSTRPRRVADYSLETLSDDLWAVIEAVSPDRPVHLVGHDWGSIQSWESVCGERFAHRIASFTSISGPCIDHAAHWLRRRLRSGSAAQLRQALRQFSHSWYIGLFQLPGLGPAAWNLGFDRLWPRMLERMEGIRGVEPSASQGADGRYGVNLYRANFTRRLRQPQERRTEIPVQLLCPRQDRFMVREIWDDLPQWVPRLWRRDFEAGHWMPLSHPQLLAEAIGGFVQHIEGASETPLLRRARRAATRRDLPDAGKLVVVTGAGSGIGRETALAFAERGADIIAVDINLAAAERTAELVRLLDMDAQARQVDVGSAEQMEALARGVAQEWGAPDVVVNNAGIGMSGAVLDMSTADWERILRVNLWGVIHGSRLFGQQMLAAGKRGNLVNVSSGLAFFPTRITPAYNTTKAAVQMLSECLRAELAGQGIGVSAVYPGIVDTGIVNATQFVGKNDAAQQRERGKADRLYKLRNLKPVAVARAIVDAVAHNRPEVRVGAEVHAIRYLSRLAPGLARSLARIDAP